MRMPFTRSTAATLGLYLSILPSLLSAGGLELPPAPVCFPESLAALDSSPVKDASCFQQDASGAIAQLVASVRGGLLTAPAVPPANCNDQFAGPFFGASFQPNAWMVSCWTFVLDPAATIVDGSGTPVTMAAIPFGEELVITGCLQPDFTILAHQVIWNNSTVSVLASTAAVDVALGNTGATSWFVQSTTAASVAATGAGNPNPTMTFVVGQRYHFSFANSAVHPFALMSKGATPTTDQILLVHGSGVGALESDAGIDWVESGPDFFFTVTQQLADAMNGTSDNAAAYRCNVHTGSMQGGVLFSVPSAVGDWELFE